MRVRTWFVLVLCLLACVGCGRQKSTTQLLEDLKGKQEGDRIKAVRNLAQRQGESARTLPAMIEVFKDTSGDVRRSAAIALGALGEQAKDAIPGLQALQSDSDARTREAASRALSRIDPTNFSAPVVARPAKGK